jgi:8-oxo-dGTP pyrophosphatase MutT (NUDIX family)
MHSGGKQLPTKLPVRSYSAAGGVVVDPASERILVLLRPKRLGPDGRPEVRLPKGHIEPGESRRQAAVREVREEAGFPDVDIVADLGHQVIEFSWKDRHYVRDESYFLMTVAPDAASGQPEKQFRNLWLTWEQALLELTFRAEREWVVRARRTWEGQPEGPH